YRLYVATSGFLISLFFLIIALVDFISIQGYYTYGPHKLTAAGDAANVAALLIILMLPLILLSVSPATVVAAQLITRAPGLLLLIALSELAKPGLDLTAPKPHG